MGRRRGLPGPSTSRIDALRLLVLPLMLVVVAIDAEQLPVAAVGRVVVVVVVAMMDGELADRCVRSNSRAQRPQIHG